MRIWIIILIIAVVGLGLWYLLTREPSLSLISRSSPTPSVTESPTPSLTPTSSPSPGKTSSPSPTKSPTLTITLTSSGANPKTLNIKAGSTVTFVNNDSALHWPASNPHPLHTDCPGFDALKGLKTGEKYSFTFTQAKTCGFHDHLNDENSSFSGQIIVSQ